MRFVHFLMCAALIALLVWMNRFLVPDDAALFGGLTFIGWASIGIFLFAVAFLVVLNDSVGAFSFFRARGALAPEPLPVRTLERSELKELGLTKYRGPDYPHPVIFPDRCIGCQACVDACPHDVLAIVDGRAAAVAPDLCMEDTACQAECPVNPKACIVINTTKEVRSLPAPLRDTATYQTNVPGCYIIGDVSGVPLIKNAVKEGAEVIKLIADGLRSAPPEPKAEFEVAIIGIGPGGASAAATAHDLGLRYIGIEQDEVLISIRMYPKGKYIFFKPDSKIWTGGLTVTGLGLSKAKYGSGTDVETDGPFAALDGELTGVLNESIKRLHDLLIAKVPLSFRAEVSPLLNEKLHVEFRRHIASYLRSKALGDIRMAYKEFFLPEREALMKNFSQAIADELQSKIPGDQRENILAVWLGGLFDRGVTINEHESCKSVSRAHDGDYFVIATERGTEKAAQTYTAMRVVLAIGLRGAPNRLRLPNEDMKIAVNGRLQPKVLYSLSNPGEYRGRHIAIVGGGNSAVEAAVDLSAKREGTRIVPRPPDERNRVTLLVRDYLAPTVKFGNKLQMYHCADEEMLDLRIGVSIKEMRENELVLQDAKTGAELETIPNDFVFALIGGERPDRFLKSIGIKIV